jgi:hypothetical protein
MIYLTHPDHGGKICYTDAEAALDEKNGWKRTIEGEDRPIPAVVEAEAVKRKPGRPKKSA